METYVKGEVISMMSEREFESGTFRTWKVRTGKNKKGQSRYLELGSFGRELEVGKSYLFQVYLDGREWKDKVINSIRIADLWEHEGEADEPKPTRAKPQAKTIDDDDIPF